MSATASVLAAFQPRRKRRSLFVEFWDKLPKPNAHHARYCVRIQDALRRYPQIRALYDMLRKKAARFDKERKTLEASLTDLCIWIGDTLRTLNPGESDIAAEPVARSTIKYWLKRLWRLHLLTLRDPDTGEPCGPRKRGDGRHKSTWFIHSYDFALDELVKDPEVAIPKNRTFWVRDGWPVDHAEAATRELDKAVEARMPDAWENNARSKNPLAPIKPLRRTVTLYASAAEAVTVQRALVSEPWKIATTPEQARERLLWAREVEDADRIPADWIAAYMNRALEGILQRHRKANRYAPDPVHQIGLFDRDFMRGAAGVWIEEQRRVAAEAAASAPSAVSVVVEDGSGADPPPEFRNLRTRFS